MGTISCWMPCILNILTIYILDSELFLQTLFSAEIVESSSDTMNAHQAPIRRVL